MARTVVCLNNEGLDEYRGKGTMGVKNVIRSGMIGMTTYQVLDIRKDWSVWSVTIVY